MRARGPRRATAAGALVLLVLVGPSARADRAADLDQLREAIARSRERVAEFERQQRSLLETIEAIDRAAAALVREVAAARERAAAAEAELRAVEAEAADAVSRLAATERAMSRRAVALYKAGERAGLRMLFSAGGLREFLARFSALELLLSRDAELLARHRQQTARLAAARDKAQRAAEVSESAAAELRERGRQLRDEQAARRRLVARVHDDRSRERQALVELEAAARALEETLASLQGADRGEEEALAGPAFASRKRALPHPVEGRISRGFGRVVDSEFFTETFRKGVEYDAPQGAPVRAVAPGHVRYAGWFRGFGRLVILDHGDQFFTVSGHLADMAVAAGDRVTAGQVIGSVGDTGSLTGPQLYFEIREGSRPVDPAEWLRPTGSR